MFGRFARPDVEVHHENDPADTLLCGFSEFGLAGVTAVEYLVTQLDLRETGHVAVDEMPAITPFENGTPRHHTRLYSRPDLDVTVLIGELPVPAFAARSFTDAIIDWAGRHSVEEVVLLSGVPVEHGPDQHEPFYIASPDYQRVHGLADTSIDPMAGGFLDGVGGALSAHGLATPLRTCVFTTPAHASAPDVEAALRLLKATLEVYGFDVETGPLEAFAAEVSAHYQELATRVEQQREAEAPAGEDRMYM